MATLRDPDGRTRPVPARLLIGRSASCGLRLTDKLASSEHAALAWMGTGWTVRDLSSKNGTFVDGVLLPAGVAEPLVPGARLAFGNRDATWELVDDLPPVPMATDLSTGDVVASDGILVLPNDDEPILSYYEDSAGRWVEENLEGEKRVLDEDTVVTVEGRSFIVQLPGPIEHTPRGHSSLVLSSVTLEFGVSRNEERVEIRVLDGAVRLRLEPREHGYILLTLARAAAEDRDLPPDSRGWRYLEDLQRMLAVDANALNVGIHRARKQFRAAGIVDAANIVEVRRGQRRIGTMRFRIIPLDVLA